MCEKRKRGVKIMAETNFYFYTSTYTDAKTLLRSLLDKVDNCEISMRHIDEFWSIRLTYYGLSDNALVVYNDDFTQTYPDYDGWETEII